MRIAGFASRNIVSGFTLTGVQAVISLLVVRAFVLHLDKATYGVCMAVSQVTVFMAFLDLGMGPALARFMVDYRRTTSAAEYGGLFKAALGIGVLQCIACLLLMVFGSSPIAGLLRISDTSRPLFMSMMMWMALPTAACFLARPFGQVLYSTGRIYAVNVLSMIAAVLQGTILLVGLRSGWGPKALVAGHWAFVLCLQGMILAESFRSGGVPSLRVPFARMSALRPLLGFSRDVFIATFGRQLLQFAPTVLISRAFGEARLGDWHAGTRVLLFVWQLVGRVPAGVEPLFWRIYASGEVGVLRERVKDTIRVTTAVSCSLGAVLILLNSPFVAFWTDGLVTWNRSLDILCATWIFVVSLALPGGTLLGTTKRVGKAQYVYFAEVGTLFLASCIPGLDRYGFSAAVLALVAAHVVFSLTYHTMRVRLDLGFAWTEIASAYGRPVAVFVLICGVSAAVSHLLPVASFPTTAIAALAALPMAIGPVVWFALVPRHYRTALVEAVRRRMGFDFVS